MFHLFCDNLLVDISFEVRAGETIVLYGAAGSGKTVLLKTAIGLIRPDSGRTYLFGQDITELPEEELYRLPHRKACCSRKARCLIRLRLVNCPA